MEKVIYTVVRYHRVIGDKVWNLDSTLCAYTNKENALRYCAKENDNAEGYFIEFKYEIHEIYLFN